jgi:hypothetical protein
MQLNNITAEILEAIENNSVWRPLSVEQEPQTRLLQWRVMKLSNGDIHFVGRADWEGRVCSAVQTYDPETKRGVTRSGRVYELLGPSGYNTDAMYVWSRWCRINDVNSSDVVDITKEYENE